MPKSAESLKEIDQNAALSAPVEGNVVSASAKLTIQELELPEIREQANAMSCD